MLREYDDNSSCNSVVHEQVQNSVGQESKLKARRLYFTRNYDNWEQNRGKVLRSSRRGFSRFQKSAKKNQFGFTKGKYPLFYVFLENWIFAFEESAALNGCGYKNSFIGVHPVITPKDIGNTGQALLKKQYYQPHYPRYYFSEKVLRLLEYIKLLLTIVV